MINADVLDLVHIQFLSNVREAGGLLILAMLPYDSWAEEWHSSDREVCLLCPQVYIYI